MLNIIEINNFNAPELDVYARYTEAQLLNKDRQTVWKMDFLLQKVRK